MAGGGSNPPLAGGERRMRNKVVMLCISVLLVSAGIVCAGWMRINGKTSYSPEATPVSCWTRDSAGDIYPQEAPLVYPSDSLQTPAHAGQSSIPYTGYWVVDSSGDYYPNAGLKAYGNRGNLQSARDVEWDVDSSGDIFPKQ